MVPLLLVSACRGMLRSLVDYPEEQFNVSLLDTNTQHTTLSAGEAAALPPAAARANLITISAAHAVIHGVSILMPLIFPILHD